MRFLNVRAERFGPLSNWEMGADAPLPGLIAVLGPNEAGKSSVRELLTGILFGIYPASRDANPWTPWAGGDIEIRATLTTGSGEEIEVHRRLLASPWGEMSRAGRVEELANRNLPEVRHLRREVFLHSHALTLGELAGLNDEGWDAVQERLVTGMGARDLRSPGEVAKELRAQASALWRSHRRGTPRHSVLQAELQELRSARRQAMERDRELREVLVALDALRRKRGEVHERRARLAERVDRLELLQPFRARLSQLDRLRAAMGDAASLDGIPPSPRERLRELRERLEEAREAERMAGERVAALREVIHAVTPEDRLLLEHREAASTLADQVTRLHERAERRGALEQELKELDARLTDVAGPLLEEPGRSISPDPFTRLSMAELRRAIPALDEARRRQITAAEALEAARDRPLPPPPGSSLPWLGLMAAGVVVLIAAWFLEMTPFLWLGGLLLVAAGVPLARWWLQRATRMSASKLREEELARADERARTRMEESEEARGRVAELLSGLPLRPALMDDPGLPLLAELERLRDLLNDRAARSRARDAISQADDNMERNLNELRRVAAPFLPTDPARALPKLGELLRDAVRREERASEAETGLEKAVVELERIRARREELETRLTSLEAEIRKAVGDETSDALTAVEERMAARRRYEEAREEFENAYPEADELRERLVAVEAEEGEAWADDEESLTNARLEVSATHSEETRLGSEIAQLEAQIAQLEKEPTPDHIDGEIEAISEELRTLRRDHDRLFLLARIVEHAEHRFREAHQPDLVRGAERHLATITGGRYAQLLLAEGDEGPIRLQAPHLPHTHPIAAPLSTGTREQAYLALRLAVATHLDEGHEPLPLFLDELFVNWDPKRRARGLDLVRELSEERQTLLFTCHPEMAEQVEARGGLVVTLPDPST